MQKQKQIKKLRPLIAGSIFLEEDLKRTLLENLDRVSNADLRALASLFEDAKKRQDALIDDMATYDKAFVDRLKQFKKSQVMIARKKIEKKQRKKEKPEEILEKILKELE